MKKKREVREWVIPTIIILMIGIIVAIVFLSVALILIQKDKSENTSEKVTASVSNENAEDHKTKKDESIVKKEAEEPSKETVKQDVQQEPIRGYVNTFGGYTGLFAANGGNVTKQGSNFDKAGLSVEIYIEDDDDKIIEAFENDEIQFFAMTVNKMAMLTSQFEDKGIETVMPYFLDTSTGGDGIVTDIGIETITDLKDVKIGMAKNSVSTAIPVWFLNESGLTEEEVQKIVDDFVLFDSTQDAVEAFVNGEIEAVSTWDMTGALAKENSHLLVSTGSDISEYLVIDGLVFKKEFAKNHQDEITSMIDAMITTVNDINNDINTYEYYEAIRQAVSDYSDYSDEDIVAEISYAKFLGFSGNLQAFDVANDIYKDFSKVWKQLGFETDESYDLIDNSYITSLTFKWEGKESWASASTFIGSEDYVDKEALLSEQVYILFNGDSYEFRTGYEQINKELLDRFIKRAKILNGTMIKISGHVNLGPGSSVWDEETKSYKIAEGFSSSEFAYWLSLMRANTVKEYMVSQGIPSERIVTEGLGGDYPIDTNDTQEGQNNNKSCDIGYYQAGY